MNLYGDVPSRACEALVKAPMTLRDRGLGSEGTQLGRGAGGPLGPQLTAPRATHVLAQVSILGHSHLGFVCR